MIALPANVHLVYGLASFLLEHGADSIIVAGIDYVFARENPLYEKLTAGLR